jgi:hypothetical protein
MRRARPVDEMQRTVIGHFAVHGAPGVFAFHVPNGGHRKPIEARIGSGWCHD